MFVLISTALFLAVEILFHRGLKFMCLELITSQPKHEIVPNQPLTREEGTFQASQLQ